MKDKELTELVNRIERIFPHLKLYYEGEEFYDDTFIKSGKRSDIEKMHSDWDYAPPKELDWYDIIKTLNENGLEIKNKK